MLIALASFFFHLAQIDGQNVGIKTSTIEETSEAFSMLVIYASRSFLSLTLPYIPSPSSTLSSLSHAFFSSYVLTFIFHLWLERVAYVGLGSAFGPYMEETMNLSLKNLTFFFHDDVRQSASMLVSHPIAAPI